MRANKSKIAVVTPDYFPQTGGLENYARHSVHTLRDAGYHVVVFTSAHKDERRSTGEVEGVKVHRLPRLFTVFHTPVHPLWPLWLRILFKSEGINVIIAHTPVPVMADAARLARGSRPFYVTYHNDLVKSSFIGKILCKLESRLLTRPTLAAADRIVATSEYYVQHSSVLRELDSKTVISSPGVDIDVFRRPASPRVTAARFIFVAQLDATHRHKGLDHLLEVITLTRQKVPDLSLVVVGRGNDKERYAGKADALGISDSVEFAGFVPDDELAELYSSACAVVLPSESDVEGFGMVILEAAACGVPAVATNVGGIPAAVVDGETGLLVPPGDTESLSAALVRMAVDNGFRDRLGQRAYERVTTHFTWAVQGRTLVELIENSASLCR